ncbi:MAG: subfamily B ATP-binding cassette protein MsbA [Alteromonadaceae bacterium]|jgi:subfamily B ATP-binding cassette protein MsbA
MTTTNYNQTFRRLLGYSRDYKAALSVAALGMLGYAAIDVTFISKLQPFIDDGLTNRDTDFFAVAPFFVVGAFILRGFCNFFSIYFLNWVGTNIVQTLRKQLFERIVLLPVSFHDQTSAGSLISKITFDTEQIQNACSKALIVLIREGAFVIGLLGFMFYQSWRLSAIFLLLVPFIAVIVTYVTKRFRKISQSIQASMGDVTQSAEQMIRGHKVILGFGGQTIENQRFGKINKYNRQQKMKMESTKSISVSLIQIIASFALAVVVYLAGVPGVLDTISTGTFMSIITAMIMLLRPLKQLTTVNSEFQRGMSACVSVFKTIDEPIEQDQGTLTPPRVKGEVVLKDVCFTYPSKKQAIFNHLNLTIKAGTTVAFVGRSGSGKSTISNLLPRYYNIDSGSICIDDIDVCDFTLTALRKQFAVVSQQVVLFNDTIANNISYGFEGEVTEQQLLDVATKAHVMEFVNEMPEGLKTMVGENGVMLSGGQRQRIAIARALLRDAPILILDEATSALDTESEKVIQDALDELQKNRTSIVIAHRLSTIENADKIVVIEAGKIVEQGTHLQLLANKGIYESLYTMQFGEQAGDAK